MFAFLFVDFAITLRCTTVYVYHNMRVIEKMAENEHAKTQMLLPIEYEVEIEPDTKTELSFDDE